MRLSRLGCLLMLVGCGSSVVPKAPDHSQVAARAKDELAIDSAAPGFVDAAGSCSAKDLIDGGAYATSAWDELISHAQQLAQVPDDGQPGCQMTAFQSDGLPLRTVTYDLAQRPLVEQFLQAGVVDETITHTYSGDHEVARDTHSATVSNHEEWQYDAQGRLRTYRGPNVVAEWHYDASGILTEVVRSNDRGVFQDDVYEYSALGQLVDVKSTHFVRGDGYVDQYVGSEDQYAYFAEGGQLQKETHLENSQAFGNVFGTSEEFDPQGRTVHREHWNDAFSGHADYVYDPQNHFIRSSAVQFNVFGEDDTVGLQLLAGARVPLEASVSTRDGIGTPVGPTVTRRAYDLGGRLWLEESDEDGDCHADGAHSLRYDRSGVLRQEAFTGSFVVSDVVMRLFTGRDCRRP